MKKFLKIFAILIFIIVVIYVAALFKRGTYSQRYSRTLLATINESRSTNTIGYILTLYTDGSGSLEYEQEPPRLFFSEQRQHFNKGTWDINKLKTDLQVVGNVSTIVSPQACGKSVSFGTVLTITYNGHTSGDLSCPYENDIKVNNIKTDLSDIMKNIKIF